MTIGEFSAPYALEIGAERDRHKLTITRVLLKIGSDPRLLALIWVGLVALFIAHRVRKYRKVE